MGGYSLSTRFSPVAFFAVFFYEVAMLRFEVVPATNTPIGHNVFLSQAWTIKLSVKTRFSSQMTANPMVFDRCNVLFNKKEDAQLVVDELNGEAEGGEHWELKKFLKHGSKDGE